MKTKTGEERILEMFKFRQRINECLSKANKHFANANAAVIRGKAIIERKP